MVSTPVQSTQSGYRKRTEKSVRGLLEILRAEAARQEAEEAARDAARQPVKALPAAVKQELVEQITAEPEDRQGE